MLTLMVEAKRTGVPDGNVITSVDLQTSWFLQVPVKKAQRNLSSWSSQGDSHQWDETGRFIAFKIKCSSHFYHLAHCFSIKLRTLF